jgi:hypothetical protein
LKKLIFRDMCFESGFLLSLCPYYQPGDLPSHPKGSRSWSLKWNSDPKLSRDPVQIARELVLA